MQVVLTPRPLGVMRAPVRRARLGQAPARMLRVVVTDAQDRPFSGVSVSADRAAVMTDARGLADLPWSGGSVTVVAEAGGVRQSKALSAAEAASGDAVFFQFPLRAPEPLAKPAEIAAGLGGAALAAVGFATGLQPLQILGEVLFGAAAFTVIYRHTC